MDLSFLWVSRFFSFFVRVVRTTQPRCHRPLLIERTTGTPHLAEKATHSISSSSHRVCQQYIMSTRTTGMEAHASRGGNGDERHGDMEEGNHRTEEGNDDAKKNEEEQQQQQGLLAWIDPTPKNRPPTPWQSYYGWFVCDVLLCIVVLNLAAELVSNIHVERFSISIFTAMVLKLILDAIEWIEHYLHHLICVQWERKNLGSLGHVERHI